MGKFETGNELAILSAGRVPSWVEQSPYEGTAAFAGAPASAASGVPMNDAVVAVIAVEMRQTAHYRTARVTVTTVDLAATTYTVTINGTAHNVAPAFADRAEIISDLVTAINGGAQAALVTASSADEDDSITGNDTLLIVGDVEADFTIGVSVAGGTGVLACKADPSSGTLRVWVKAEGSDVTEPTRPTAWLHPYGAEYTLNQRGYVERWPVAGLERVYVELDDLTCAGDTGTVTYQPTVKIGPCVTEG